MNMTLPNWYYFSGQTHCKIKWPNCWRIWTKIFLFQITIAPDGMPTRSPECFPSLNIVRALCPMVVHDSASCQVYLGHQLNVWRWWLCSLVVIAAVVCKHLGINDGATISNYTDLLLGHTGGISPWQPSDPGKLKSVHRPGGGLLATSDEGRICFKRFREFHWIFSSDVTVSWRMSTPGNLVK